MVEHKAILALAPSQVSLNANLETWLTFEKSQNGDSELGLLSQIIEHCWGNINRFSKVDIESSVFLNVAHTHTTLDQGGD